MAAEWKAMPLGECVDFKSGGTPSKSNDAYWAGDIPWVSAKDMKTFRLHDAEDHVTPDALNAGSRLAKKGSVFLLVRGMTLHRDIPICIAMRDMAFNQDIKALIARPEVDPAFLAYWLVSQKVTLLGHVDSAGHGTGRLNTDTLKAMRIELPPLTEQKRIAGILGALDDKIELNRQMNETLEQMAKALFKSWFVDFDPVRAKAAGRQPAGMDKATADLFPDSFVDSELGRTPKGWRVGALSDISEFSRSSINPGNSPEEIFDHYSLPSFDEGRIPKTEAGNQIKSNKLTVTTSCVLLSKLNPHIPRIWLPDLGASRRSVCSTEFIVAVAKSGCTREYLYSLFSGSNFAQTYGSLVTGTTGSHQRIRPESVLQMRTIVPSPLLISCFTNIIAPMFGEISSNTKQSQALAAIREKLLPLLMGAL